MPHWGIGVRVGRLLRRRLPFLFMRANAIGSGADGNNQVAALVPWCQTREPITFKSSARWVRCQVDISRWVRTTNGFLLLRLIAKNRGEANEKFLAVSIYLACVIQRNFLVESGKNSTI